MANSFRRSSQRAVHGLGEARQAGLDIRAQIHPQQTASAFGQDPEVAQGLGGQGHAEGELAAGHVEVDARGRAVICRKTPLLGPPL